MFRRCYTIILNHQNFQNVLETFAVTETEGSIFFSLYSVPFGNLKNIFIDLKNILNLSLLFASNCSQIWSRFLTTLTSCLLLKRCF